MGSTPSYANPGLVSWCTPSSPSSLSWLVDEWALRMATCDNLDDTLPCFPGWCVFTHHRLLWLDSQARIDIRKFHQQYQQSHMSPHYSVLIGQFCPEHGAGKPVISKLEARVKNIKMSPLKSFEVWGDSHSREEGVPCFLGDVSHQAACLRKGMYLQYMNRHLLVILCNHSPLSINISIIAVFYLVYMN